MTVEYYESLAQQSLEQANSLINESSSHTGQTKIDMLNEAMRKSEETQNYLGEMQNLMILLPTNEKVQVQRRVQLLTTRIKEVEGRIETNKQRVKLLSNVSLDPLNNSESQTESLSRTQNAIGSACEIGTGILSSLRDQHDKLSNAMNNAKGVIASVANSATHVSNMERVARQNKIIVYTVIGLLVAGILLLLYIKF